MVRLLMICLLAAATGLAQTKDTGSQPASGQVGSQKPANTPAAKASDAKAPASEQKPEAAATQIAPQETVITIHGVCSGQADKSACTTTMSKEQFETLVQSLNATNQTITTPMRRNLGQAYVELLAGAQAGEQAGIEKTELYQEVMRVMRLRTLSDLNRRRLEEQSRNPGQDEIAAYYEAHKSDYEALTLGRLYVPKTDPSAKTASAEQKAEFQKKAQEMAATLRDRAAKSDDLDALQKECYTALGITLAPPSSYMGLIRRGSLPATQDKELFALSPGGVYLSDETIGYFIYKLRDRQTLPLETVKAELLRTMYRSKLDAKLKEIMATVHADLNEAYFGPAPPPKQTVPGPR